MSDERLITLPQDDNEGDERLVTLPQEEDERLVTLPQEEEDRLVTLPQNDDDRLVTLPQESDERLITIPQEDVDRMTTLPQEDGERLVTLPQGNQYSSEVNDDAIVKNNIKFQGRNGKTVTIQASSIISIGTGEAQIYLSSIDGSDETYVAKVLTSVTPDSGIEIRHNRDKVIEFLLGINNDPTNHILPLVETGSVKIGDKEYYVDVYPFCQGGDLLKNAPLDYIEIEKDVIPAINTALKIFHKAGFVHRDLKPDNLYRYKGNIVIADFGITCMLREDGFAIDKKKTGTLGYYAPELMSQAAVKESDYYSFGQTLWTLFSGRPMYGNLIRRFKAQGANEQRIQVNNSMMQGDYPDLDTYDFDSSNSFFNILIRGLLQYDPKSRFDGVKVDRWLKGDQSLVHEIDRFVNKETFAKPYSLLGINCWNSNDIADALSRNWEGGKELLYSGELSRFYPEEQGDDIRFIYSIENKYRNNKEFTKDTGMTELILHLSHYKLLVVVGNRFTRDNEISDIAAKAVQDRNADFREVILAELLKDWYIRRPSCNEPMIIALDHIAELLKKENLECERIAYNWLSLITKEGGEDILLDGCVSLDMFVNKVLSSSSRIYEEAIPFNPIVNSTLCYWGYYTFVEEIVKHNSTFDRYDLMLKLFERETTPATKAVVDKFYYFYGPLGYFTWWKDNIDIYQFEGKRAKELKDQIKNVAISDSQAIAEQMQGMRTLSEFYKEFRRYFESDIMMATIGIKFMRRNNFIYADDIRAFWEYSFLGSAAPIGYKYCLGL